MTEISVGAGNNKAKPVRQKGKNLLELRKDYVVIDIETTGLDPSWCEIIELAAVRVKNDEIVETYETLVKPDEEISDFIADLTGITNDMVADAPKIDEALPKFLDFLGDSTLLGHNVNFDINFIYDCNERGGGASFANDYIDTMRLARKALPELRHHRLKDLVKHFDIIVDRQHRALDDCITTHACYLRLKELIANNNISLESRVSPKAKDFTATETNIDTGNPLYGKVCVITGKLDKMTRAEAMQAVVNLGGINGDNVTKKTDFLILGNNDFCDTVKGGKSSKQKKAEELILKGQGIQILSENVFYDMISEG